MTFVLGVTGKSCSGKNYLVKLLEGKGWQSVDVDVVGHDVIDQEAGAVAKAFGPEVLFPDGKVNRKAVGRIVFGNPKALRTLELIVHPAMVRKVEGIAASTASGVLIVNAALLHRMKLDRICDLVVYVKAPFKVRLARALKRENTSAEAFIARCRSQKDINSRKICRGVKVLVVDNGNNKKKIHRQVSRLCAKLTKVIGW